MASRREQIVMSPAEVEAFLEPARTLSVATIGPTGHPHLVAMWYGFLEGQVAFWTFAKSQKIRNLRRSPLLTALVEEGTSYDQLKGVELVGRGRVVDDFDTIVQIGLSVAGRYGGPSAVADEGRAFVEAQARKRCGVVVEVERVVSWDHTKLAGAY